MADLTPRARTILLTDSGTTAFSVSLAAYDGTTLVLPSIDNTIVTSTLPASRVSGAAAAFTALYARLTPSAARSTAQAARQAALAARIASLES